jgi:hypothetical protein
MPDLPRRNVSKEPPDASDAQILADLQQQVYGSREWIERELPYGHVSSLTRTISLRRHRTSWARKQSKGNAGGE